MISFQYVTDIIDHKWRVRQKNTLVHRWAIICFTVSELKSYHHISTQARYWRWITQSDNICKKIICHSVIFERLRSGSNGAIRRKKLLLVFTRSNDSHTLYSLLLFFWCSHNTGEGDTEKSSLLTFFPLFFFFECVHFMKCVHLSVWIAFNRLSFVGISLAHQMPALSHWFTHCLKLSNLLYLHSYRYSPSVGVSLTRMQMFHRPSLSVSSANT